MTDNESYVIWKYLKLKMFIHINEHNEYAIDKSKEQRSK